MLHKCNTKNCKNSIIDIVSRRDNESLSEKHDVRRDAKQLANASSTLTTKCVIYIIKTYFICFILRISHLTLYFSVVEGLRKWVASCNNSSQATLSLQKTDH